MYTKNLTVRELFQTFETRRIKEFFIEGLRRQNDGLAISALEELNRRGGPNPVWEGLQIASEENLIREGTTFATALINALGNVNRALCPTLRRYVTYISQNGYVTIEQFLTIDMDTSSLTEDLMMEQNEGPQGGRYNF